MCLAQGHNAVMPVRLEPRGPFSLELSTIPLRSQLTSDFQSIQWCTKSLLIRIHSLDINSVVPDQLASDEAS